MGSEHLLRLATVASVVTAVVLIIAKLSAWLLTDSVSVAASLVDSTMDAFASGINLLAVHYSLQPPDEEHRFGHGKAEPLAGLAQATFIGGSAAFVILHAIDKLRHPLPMEHQEIGIGVIVFSTLATLGLLAIQRHVVRKTGSTAIKADAFHYATDVLTNLSVIAALILSLFGWSGLDPIFGIGFALYILYGAWRIGYEAFQLLMDHELPAADRERIKQIALAHAQVQGVHHLRTRQSGQTRIIQLHLDLDGSLPLAQCHAIATEVEAAIENSFPDADIIIYQDPVSAGGS
ncbi:MAG: cation diffusion facilitator family transporter [Gammaproteobacteria bacterium]